MNKCIIMLQNKLHTFYFELLTEIRRLLASCCAVVPYYGTC